MGSEPAPYRFGPPESRAFLAGLRLSQVLVLGGGAVACLGVVASVRGAPAAVAAALICGSTLAAAFMRSGSRPPERWLPLAVRHLWRLLGDRGRRVVCRGGGCLLSCGRRPRWLSGEPRRWPSAELRPATAGAVW